MAAVLTNPRSDRVKAVRALSRQSGRLRAGLFLAEGPQVVREAVRWRPELVRELYLTAEAAARHRPIVEAAGRAGVTAVEVTPTVLAAMGDTEAPQGVLAVCRLADVPLEPALARLPAGGVVCVLTHVRDPGNAGTVIRSADAAGADLVVVSDASVDVHAPKVVRSTAGSLFHLPIVSGVPVQAVLAGLRSSGVALLAADGGGAALLPEVDLRRPHAWVMGNEAWGLEPQVRDACDEVVRVPIYGAAESLNLAMAATLCLYASAAARRR